MLHEGREVLTPETFNYETARPGDYVSEQIVDDAMDCLPPGEHVRRMLPDGRTVVP